SGAEASNEGKSRSNCELSVTGWRSCSNGASLERVGSESSGLGIFTGAESSSKSKEEAKRSTRAEGRITRAAHIEARFRDRERRHHRLFALEDVGEERVVIDRARLVAAEQPRDALAHRAEQRRTGAE